MTPKLVNEMFSVKWIILYFIGRGECTVDHPVGGFTRWSGISTSTCIAATLLYIKKRLFPNFSFSVSALRSSFLIPPFPFAR